MLGWPGRAHERGAERIGGCDHELDRDAVRRDAGRGVEQRDDLGQGGEALARGRGIVGRDDHGEARRLVHPAPRVAGRVPAERRGDRRSARGRAGAAGRVARRCVLLRERGEDPRLALRPDAGHLAQTALLRGPPQLAGGRDVERRADLDRALGAEPEHPAERDELERRRAAQLGELRDLARLDELPQPRLDAAPDAAQLAHPALPHERRHRRPARARTSSAARRYARAL